MFGFGDDVSYTTDAIDLVSSLAIPETASEAFNIFFTLVLVFGIIAYMVGTIIGVIRRAGKND